jgi:hypothetical protein
LVARSLAIAGLLFATAVSVSAGDDQTNSPSQVKPAEPANPRDLTELSLDDLTKIHVTLVSKKEEKLSESPAAISVLTQEDIRRSGATSIPEALRLIPGLDVAQVDAHTWAISARGFNDVFANKLLVMQDGRSLYTPLFSGVFWDVQDSLMEDIDRIEVIRGPGASLWGARAGWSPAAVAPRSAVLAVSATAAKLPTTSISAFTENISTATILRFLMAATAATRGRWARPDSAWTGMLPGRTCLHCRAISTEVVKTRPTILLTLPIPGCLRCSSRITAILAAATFWAAGHISFPTHPISSSRCTTTAPSAGP